MKVKYSIIIPAYKPDLILLKRLQDYLKENVDSNFEYYIIEGKNGLANAYNEGIKKAKGEIIITIHSDCVPIEADGLRKLVRPFNENEKIVLSYSWINHNENKNKLYPHVPDGKFTAYRKSALEKVGLFDSETFFTGGEDVDIYLKLKKIGNVKKVDTGILHTHPNYFGSKTSEKIKHNATMNGSLFRIYGFRNSKWLKALIMCFLYPKTYGKYFVDAYKKGKQEYRRGE